MTTVRSRVRALAKRAANRPGPRVPGPGIVEVVVRHDGNGNLLPGEQEKLDVAHAEASARYARWRAAGGRLEKGVTRVVTCTIIRVPPPLPRNADGTFGDDGYGHPLMTIIGGPPDEGDG